MPILRLADVVVLNRVAVVARPEAGDADGAAPGADAEQGRGIAVADQIDVLDRVVGRGVGAGCLKPHHGGRSSRVRIGDRQIARRGSGIRAVDGDEISAVENNDGTGARAGDRGGFPRAGLIVTVAYEAEPAPLAFRTAAAVSVVFPKYQS